MTPSRLLRGLTVVCTSLALFGCHRSRTFDSQVEITRVSVVRKDAEQKPITSDVEFSYFECPGSQTETLRGDGAFSACMAKYKVGDKVSARIEQHWVDEGHWAWTVHRIGDCEHPLDPNDEASFASIRDCEDWQVSGAKVGFACDLKAERKLLDKCPWFQRR